MPIINNYSIIGTGGGSGGTSNSEPYPFSIVTIISIPANEKFLLVPGKEHPREITLGFTEPIDLYFGSDEVSFRSISVGERFRDTQLGVDLWVKSLVECQALVIIRSMELINYIGEPPEPPAPSKVSIVPLDNYSNGFKVNNQIEGIYQIKVNYTEAWLTNYFIDQIAVEGIGNIRFDFFKKIADNNYQFVALGYPNGSVIITSNTGTDRAIEDNYTQEGTLFNYEFVNSEQIFRIVHNTGYVHPAFISSVSLDEIEKIILINIAEFSYPRESQDSAFFGLLTYPPSPF